jgi:hypothetical protein
MTILVVALTGCTAPTNPPDEPGDDPRSEPAYAALPGIPEEYDLTFDAEMGANEWILWLWRNDFAIGDEELGLSASHEVQVETKDDSSRAFWLGAYFINVAIDEATGKALHMSARATPWVEYTSNEAISNRDTSRMFWEEGSVPRRAVDVEGVLMFSEAPVTMRILTRMGGGAHEIPPADPWKGTNLSVTVPPIAELGDDKMANLSFHIAAKQTPGFAAAWPLADVGPPYAGLVEFELDLAFPDSDRRVRTMMANALGSVAGYCHPAPAADPGAFCRQSISQLYTIDLSNSCQPVGDSRADITIQRPSADIRPGLAIINVPFDYCGLFGADASTPHPCADMTTMEYRGCPGN